MNFPIIVFPNVPLWYSWIGTIGAIIILLAAVIICVVFDDCNDKEEEVKLVLMFVFVGIMCALIWLAAWIIIIPFIVVYAIRFIYWKIYDYIYYLRHDR